MALVVGVPMDFRLGFGALVRRGHQDRACIDSAAARPRPPRDAGRSSCTAASRPRSTRCARAPPAGPDRSAWIEAPARGSRTRSAPASRRSSTDDRAPLHPLRVYHELSQVLDRDTVVIGDGGDFVSYAGRVIDTYEPGCWMDPGPFGCLGAGPGYALAAKLANPDRQVCLLLGDGAFGFAGMEFDTLVRHGVPVVARDGQQRHLGAGEAPDGVPLRLLGRRRAPAGVPLRPGGRGAGRPRRAGASARTSCGRRSSARSPAASRRSSTCSPTPRSPTRAGRTWPRAGRGASRRSENRPAPENETARPKPGGSLTAPSGRAGVRALKGPCGPDGGRRRYDAASPEPMYRAQRGPTG